MEQSAILVRIPPGCGLSGATGRYLVFNALRSYAFKMRKNAPRSLILKQMSHTMDVVTITESAISWEAQK